MCIKLSYFNTCNFFRQKRDENGNGNDDEDDDYDDNENLRHYDILIVSIIVSKIQWNRNISCFKINSTDKFFIIRFQILLFLIATVMKE